MGGRVIVILSAVLLGQVVVDFLFIEHHHVFPWHRLTGYLAVIGLVGCAVVVILSKLLGKYWLQRPENFDD